MSKEVHIKIPKEQYDYIMEFRLVSKVSLQKFVVKAIQEKIDNIKKTT